MARTKEKKNKTTEKDLDRAYELNEEDLKNKEEKLLEKSWEILQDNYNRHLEMIKNFDNKASLLLVVYVGIFSIFSCFLGNWKLENLTLTIIACILFGLTVISYFVSIIFLIKTIRTRTYMTPTPKGLFWGNSNKYKDWLIAQIITKSEHLRINIKKHQKKVEDYNIGRISLIVSVFLTLILASFFVCCNVF